MALLNIDDVEKKSGQSEKSFVVAGAKIKCSYGDKETKLTAPFSHGYYLKDKAVLNITDFVPMKNVFPFGKCSSMLNPVVATATAANKGVLKPMPCIPVITGPWIGGKTNVLIENQPGLLIDCKNFCSYCGQITIQEDGQE